MAGFAPLLNHRHFRLGPLQVPSVQDRRGLKPGIIVTEMKLLMACGKIFSGEDALLKIAKRIWCAWPLIMLAKMHGITPLFHVTYRRLAVNRTCFDGKCLIPKNHEHKLK